MTWFRLDWLFCCQKELQMLWIRRWRGQNPSGALALMKGEGFLLSTLTWLACPADMPCQASIIPKPIAPLKTCKPKHSQTNTEAQIHRHLNKRKNQACILFHNMEEMFPNLV